MTQLDVDMAVEITIPRLGWNMEEGVFVGWLKQDGEAVKPGDALFTLEGEKATEEIECLDKGLLRIAPGGPAAGDKIAVGAVIGYVTAADEEWGTRAADAVATETVPAAPVEVMAPGPRPSRHHQTASPRARRVARELGVDWKTVQGGGRTGRIRERDVRAAAGAASVQTTVSPLRKTIAERMTASLRSTAPVTLTTTVDASNLVNLRGQFKAAGGDIVPGYTDFLVKLSAAALQKHPLMGASWAGAEMAPMRSVDIGIAVDADAGLFVPVVRDAPSLSIRQVAASTRDLAKRARAGRLQSSEMQGGVFTITNLGAFGVEAFTPIINFPQCAILGVGRIQHRPVAAGDKVLICEQVTLSLTFDHRIVDGAPAARFLQTLCQMIENPGPWLMP
jgi:pyruvate dehydrogenase E2 component (dihydrolipoamide acetyltransferase)